MAAEKESLFEGGHPKLKTGTGSVTGSRPVAESTWLIEFSAPELACAVEPGHFVMLRLPELYSPLLGRPFAVYRADRAAGRVQVIYLVVGNMTGRLSRIEPGTPLEWWGPLGSGWAPIEEGGRSAAKRIFMAAGGIGCEDLEAMVEMVEERLVKRRRLLLSIISSTVVFRMHLIRGVAISVSVL